MKSGMKLRRAAGFVMGLLVVVSSYAQQSAVRELPFVKALSDGQAMQDLPEHSPFQAAARYIQSTTGNPGPVNIIAYRVKKFHSQPKCGRIAFGLYQASTKTFWGQLGGQINICADGLPPKRICKAQPGKLVEIDARCPDGSPTADAPEVADAINEALKGGGLSSEEVHKRIKASTAPAAKTEISGDKK